MPWRELRDVCNERFSDRKDNIPVTVARFRLCRTKLNRVARKHRLSYFEQLPRDTFVNVFAERNCCGSIVGSLDRILSRTGGFEIAIGPDGEGLIFLLGLPRSGTTLLSVMLDNHPHIASPPEPWLMLAFAELGRVTMRHPANAGVLGKAVRNFAGEEGCILAARAAVRALYGAHLESVEKHVFVDKTPRYALIPEFLIAVFPRARFIWLRRDPLDIAASYGTTWNIDLAAALSEGRDFPELFDFTIGLDRLARFYAAHRESVYVIWYEQLVKTPRAALAGLLQHVGLPAGPVLLDRMMAFDGAARPADALGDTKIRATSAPHSNSVGTWRAAFDQRQLQVLLDAVGSDRMIELGYAATVAALADRGVRQSDPAAPLRYRAKAEALLAAREADIVRTTTQDCLDATVQARIHAAIAGDDAWMALAKQTADRLAAAERDKPPRARSGALVNFAARLMSQLRGLRAGERRALNHRLL